MHTAEERVSRTEIPGKFTMVMQPGNVAFLGELVCYKTDALVSVHGLQL